MTTDDKQTLGRFVAACRRALEKLTARKGSMLEGFPKEAFNAIRMALIAKPASAELGGAPTADAAHSPSPDELLTTAEAAARLEVSRPYVSMLCDQGKLGEVVMTEGAHRRIRLSAVEAYLADRTKQQDGALSPREAAAKAGLYSFSESHFRNVVREPRRDQTDRSDS
jgi:excisionase family DNA binding protein